jgi:hypothetical protein
VLRTTTVWTTAQGSPYFTTLHYGGLAQADADAALDATADLWEAIDTEMFAGIQWSVENDVPSIDPVTGDTIGMFTGTGRTGFGQGAGEVLPWATQGLFRWRTGVYLGGREIRGRSFIPGLRETSNTEGSPTPSMVTGLNTVLSTWLGGLPAGRKLTVWSRARGEAVDVNSGTMWSEWATLRSRRD